MPPEHEALRGFHYGRLLSMMSDLPRSRHLPLGDVSQTSHPCVMLSNYEPAPPRPHPPATDHSACRADSNSHRAADARSSTEACEEHAAACGLRAVHRAVARGRTGSEGHGRGRYPQAFYLSDHGERAARRGNRNAGWWLYEP